MVIAAYSRPVEGSRHIVRVRVLLLVRAYVRVRMCYVLYYTYSLTEFQNFICEHENARVVPGCQKWPESARALPRTTRHP